jgi:hypothetical protein
MFVIAGLVPAIHVLQALDNEDVDARHSGPVLGLTKPEHSKY